MIQTQLLLSPAVVDFKKSFVFCIPNHVHSVLSENISESMRTPVLGKTRKWRNTGRCRQSFDTVLRELSRGGGGESVLHFKQLARHNARDKAVRALFIQRCLLQSNSILRGAAKGSIGF